MLSFSNIKFQKTAFSDKPFQLLRPEERVPFSLVMEIIMLETGDPEARRHWQNAQLANLLAHAHSRSEFWRKRIGKNKPAHIGLKDLPILSRQDVHHQLQMEGPLLSKADGVELAWHATSGSTGTPLKFVVANSNSLYNGVRNFTQYLLSGADITANRFYCNQKVYDEKDKFLVEKLDSYGGIFSNIFKTGRNTNLTFNRYNRDRFVECAREAEAGLWVLGGPVTATLPTNFTAKEIYDLGARHWVTIGGPLDPLFRKELLTAGVTANSNYSSEEVGLIGTECGKQPGHFHVASSNVIVEEVGSVDYDGELYGHLLVTHLSSYAMPLIRYDLGDLGRVTDACPCGHNGPTISRLIGRTVQSLLLPSGKRMPFVIRAREINEVAELIEYRARQIAYDKIIFEAVTPAPHVMTRQKLTDFLLNLVGDSAEVEVEVIFRDAIDWGASAKRQTFRCEVVPDEKASPLR
jgi:phenylacetate-coenzyme A ligase PaaK-like adenylate-forming protein